MNQNETGRYVRWQDYRIQQLSFSINLFLGFAVASLAFAINLKLNPPKTLGFDLAYLRWVIYFWSGSLVMGCIATISRLLDFRYTAKKIKYRKFCHKCIAKICGKITWGSFWLQITTYVIGSYLFILKVAMVKSGGG